MKTICQVKGHANSPVSLLCTNPECKKNPISCAECFRSMHSRCSEFTVPFGSLLRKEPIRYKSRIQSFLEIKETFERIEKVQLQNEQDRVYNMTKAYLEKEAAKAIELFSQKVHLKKGKMLQKTSELVKIIDLDLEQLGRKLQEVYNFNSLFDISELWVCEERLNVGSETLDTVLKGSRIDSNQPEEPILDLRKALQRMSSINSQGLDYLELIKEQSSVASKTSVQFENSSYFNDNSETSWSWNPLKKSQAIMLTESNTRAINVTQGDCNHSFVLGNIYMSRGHYKWQIEIDTEDLFWISFGIVEARNANNLKYLKCENTISFSPHGILHQLVDEGKLKDYKNKIYLCDLDMMKGTFTISCDGIVLARQQKNLRNKTFVPFLHLYCNGNTAKLHMVNETIRTSN